MLHSAKVDQATPYTISFNTILYLFRHKTPKTIAPRKV